MIATYPNISQIMIKKVSKNYLLYKFSAMIFVFRPDNDVPELSYGVNQRMPSASVAIDIRFSPDKGRFFVATQDLMPGHLTLTIDQNKYFFCFHWWHYNQLSKVNSYAMCHSSNYDQI